MNLKDDNNPERFSRKWKEIWLYVQSYVASKQQPMSYIRRIIHQHVHQYVPQVKARVVTPERAYRSLLADRLLPNFYHIQVDDWPRLPLLLQVDLIASRLNIWLKTQERPDEDPLVFYACITGFENYFCKLRCGTDEMRKDFRVNCQGELQASMRYFYDVLQSYPQFSQLCADLEWALGIKATAYNPTVLHAYGQGDAPECIAYEPQELPPLFPGLDLKM